MGDCIGEYYRLIKGDARGSESGSYSYSIQLRGPPDFGITD